MRATPNRLQRGDGLDTVGPLTQSRTQRPRSSARAGRQVKRAFFLDMRRQGARDAALLLVARNARER